jgi:hypothetical protein
MIVGARMLRTCRSTNDSHEHNAMPMHGTHTCHPTAPAVVAGAAALMVFVSDIVAPWRV